MTDVPTVLQSSTFLTGALLRKNTTPPLRLVPSPICWEGRYHFHSIHHIHHRCLSSWILAFRSVHSQLLDRGCAPSIHSVGASSQGFRGVEPPRPVLQLITPPAHVISGPQGSWRIPSALLTD